MPTVIAKEGRVTFFMKSPRIFICHWWKTLRRVGKTRVTLLSENEILKELRLKDRPNRELGARYNIEYTLQSDSKFVVSP